MLNKIILMGNIGRAREFSLTQEGKETARFFLATSTSWKREDGEWQTHTDWHLITVLKEPTIRWMKDVLKQGTTVYLEGKLSYHLWTDTFGQAHVTPHIMITKGEGRVEFIRSPRSGVQYAVFRVQKNRYQNNFQENEESPDVSEIPPHPQQEKNL